MKKIQFATLLFLLTAVNPIPAQPKQQLLYVMAVNGDITISSDNGSKKIGVHDTLEKEMSLTFSSNSSISILDMGAEKIYAVALQGPHKVSDIVSRERGRTNSLTKDYFTYVINEFFRNNTTTMDREENFTAKRGVVYRSPGTSCDSLLMNTLADRIGSGMKHAHPDNVGSDYDITLELIKQSDNTQAISFGDEFFFRVKNRSDTSLFVNILNVDEKGATHVCLPVDKAVTMLHLLIPAGSSVDLRDYLFEFGEPGGTERFYLIALDQPFDLRYVKTYFGEIDKYRGGSTLGSMGFAAQSIIVR